MNKQNEPKKKKPHTQELLPPPSHALRAGLHFMHHGALHLLRAVIIRRQLDRHLAGGGADSRGSAGGETSASPPEEVCTG